MKVRFNESESDDRAMRNYKTVCTRNANSDLVQPLTDFSHYEVARVD